MIRLVTKKLQDMQTPNSFQMDAIRTVCLYIYALVHVNHQS